MTTARLANRAFGSVRLEFITSASTSKRPTVEVNTATGTIKVSTPEATVLDLVADPTPGGGLSNMATVIADLLEDNKIGINQLMKIVEQCPVSVAQRPDG